MNVSNFSKIFFFSQVTVENVVATTSDMINNVIYWSDMESKKIMKMKRGESAQPLIEVNKLGQISTNKLYNSI